MIIGKKSMAQAYRPSWYPGEVFRNDKSAEPSKEFSENCIGNGIGNKSVSENVTRVKTIAKASRKELPEIKATWKSFLPALSSKDVRRYRVPHYEVVGLELEELGYGYAAQYLKMLFSLDEEMRTKTGPGTIIWSNPRLKDRNDFVDRLKISLVNANKAVLDGQYIAHVAALLETALYFEETSWEWWWIAEQLFRSALAVSESVDDDDRQTTTTIKYLYGRFLFNKMKDAETSLRLLEEARETSQDKFWNATKMLGVKQESVFKECCTLLYQASVSLGKKAQEEDVDFALGACQKALRHAIDSDHDEYITDATCELGRSYLRANQPKLALQNFAKYLTLSRKILDYEGICNAHMELAFAYKELGDTANTMEHLELFRETASRFQLPYKLAKAHYHIGEHLLSRNHIAEATSHLEFAFTLNNGMGQTVEAHQARCIAAVSRGQEVVDDYIDQILRCGKGEQRAILKLCEWKNNRVPFWRKENDDAGVISGENESPKLQMSESRSSTTVSEMFTQSESYPIQRLEPTNGAVVSLEDNHDQAKNMQIITE